MGAFAYLPPQVRDSLVDDSDLYRSSFSPKKARMSQHHDEHDDMLNRPLFNLIVTEDAVSGSTSHNEAELIPSTPCNMPTSKLTEVPGAPRKQGVRRQFNTRPIAFNLE
jgi:hypothetical protein